MRPPFYYPSGYFMNTMPMQMPMRYPMFSPYQMRGPMFSQMPMQMPRQAPLQSSTPDLAELGAAGLAGAGAAGLAGAAAAGGTPRLDSFLSGANSLFSNAQKFTPYVQQAAPMFKNIPALWRMYKGFRGNPDTSADLARDIFESTAITPTAPAAQRNTQSQPNASRTSRPSTPGTSRPSVPKIFQPPFNL